MTAVSMVIKSFSLGMFKQAPLVASGRTKPIPSHGRTCLSLPKFMPRSTEWLVKHTYCKLEQTIRVMVSLASLVACDERVQKLEPPVPVITYAQCNTVMYGLHVFHGLKGKLRSLYNF